MSDLRERAPLLRLLVVDDSKTVHAYLRSCLRDLRASVDVASAMDGQEALEKLQREPARPDLILLDWEMPRLDGPHTLERLREMGVDTPVLMMTSKNEAEDIIRCLEAGASEYMMKPFTSDILAEKVQTVLGVSLGPGDV